MDKFTVRFDGGQGIVQTWKPAATTTVDKLTTAQQKAVAAAMADYEKMLSLRRHVSSSGGFPK